MVTNVSEKDKTLHEVIDFLEKEWDAANNASDNPDEEVLKYDFYDGMTTAYEHVINYCRHLLGYSGTMPSEVPNQSEDAKNRSLSNAKLLEELLNDGWKIVRVDAIPPVELPVDTLSATNVYILEREANDD